MAGFRSLVGGVLLQADLSQVRHEESSAGTQSTPDGGLPQLFLGGAVFEAAQQTVLSVAEQVRQENNGQKNGEHEIMRSHGMLPDTRQRRLQVAESGDFLQFIFLSPIFLSHEFLCPAFTMGCG